jgi:hypothetical protein
VIRKGRSRRSSTESETTHLDILLDDALRATFPASDPVSITPDKSSNGIAADEEFTELPKAALPMQAEANSTPKFASPWEVNLWPLQVANFYAWWIRTFWEMRRGRR